jgi:hypothetical protein
LVRLLESIAARDQLDVQIGLVEFRDHPPQDSSFVTRIHGLTPHAGLAQKHINAMAAAGGGDEPEAVYDGVNDAIHKLAWRAHSLRLVLLVGDAPPHGFATRSTSGLNAHLVSSAAEEKRITVHALCMSHNLATLQAFADLAMLTGGQCVQAAGADVVIQRIGSVLDAEFGALALDRQVLARARELGDIDFDLLAENLRQPRGAVAKSIARLGRRGFFG